MGCGASMPTNAAPQGDITEQQSLASEQNEQWGTASPRVSRMEYDSSGSLEKVTMPTISNYDFTQILMKNIYFYHDSNLFTDSELETVIFHSTQYLTQKTQKNNKKF